MEDMAMETKESIRKLAQDGVITVTFTKVDGSERVMKCTLNKTHLPEQKDLEEASTKDNPKVLAVWDVEKSAWRSFRIDSVKEVAA